MCSRTALIALVVLFSEKDLFWGGRRGLGPTRRLGEQMTESSNENDFYSQYVGEGSSPTPPPHGTARLPTRMHRPPPRRLIHWAGHPPRQQPAPRHRWNRPPTRRPRRRRKLLRPLTLRVIRRSLIATRCAARWSVAQRRFATQRRAAAQKRPRRRTTVRRLRGYGIEPPKT